MVGVAAAAAGEFAAGREHIVPDHNSVCIVSPDTGIPDFDGFDHIIGVAEMVFSAGVVGRQVDPQFLYDRSDHDIALVTDII